MALNVAGIALLLGELTNEDAAMDSMPAADGRQRIAASTKPHPVSSSMWSVLFDLHRDGLLLQKQWTMVKKDIITMISEPGGREFWKAVGKVRRRRRFPERR